MLLAPFAQELGAQTAIAPKLTAISRTSSGTPAIGDTVQFTQTIDPQGNTTSYTQITFTDGLGAYLFTSQTSPQDISTLATKVGMTGGAYRCESVVVSTVEGPFALYYRDGTLSSTESHYPTTHTLNLTALDFILPGPTSIAAPLLTSVNRTSSSTPNIGDSVVLACLVDPQGHTISNVQAAFKDAINGMVYITEYSPSPTSATLITASAMVGGRYQCEHVAVNTAEGRAIYYKRDGTVAKGPAGMTGPTTHSLDIASLDFVLPGSSTVPGAELISLKRTSSAAARIGDPVELAHVVDGHGTAIEAITVEFIGPLGFEEGSVPSSAPHNGSILYTSSRMSEGPYRCTSVLIIGAQRRETTYYRDGRIQYYPDGLSGPSTHALDFSALDFAFSRSEPIVAPQISAQPVAATVTAGNALSLSVAASGTALTFQWRRNGVNIPGATSSTYSVPSATTGDSGSYDVVITNTLGSVTSSLVVVTIAPPPPSVRLTNISTRAYVGTGGDVLIGGFIIAGNAPKTVLIRASGPALTPFGVSGALADPTVELHLQGATGILASNDNWGDDAGQKTALLQAFTTTGAFPWTDGSKDAAIITTLQPGGYTAIIAGKNTTTGAALIEVYEMDSTNGAAKLVNLSSRALVQTGGDVQIAGFIISGSGDQKVIIRASGPALTQYGVTGVLADPQLEIRRMGSTAVLAHNDNWDPALKPEFTASGIDNWATGSKDAALLLTLPAGAYTAVVTGVNTTTGVALVEVFDRN